MLMHRFALMNEGEIDNFIYVIDSEYFDPTSMPEKIGGFDVFYEGVEEVA